MNIWLQQSIDYANTRSYLDDLYSVYPKLVNLDGVCYLDRQDKMCLTLRERYSEYNIMSALLLRNFLYTVR